MTVRSVVAQAAWDTASAARGPPLQPRSVSSPRKWDLLTLQKPNLIHEDDMCNVNRHLRCADPGGSRFQEQNILMQVANTDHNGYGAEYGPGQ